MTITPEITEIEKLSKNKSAVATDNLWQALIDKWEEKSQDFINSDGNNPNFPNGGFNIKANANLIDLIRDIRDSYFVLLLENDFITRIENREKIFDVYTLELSIAINDLQHDFIKLNAESLQKINNIKPKLETNFDFDACDILGKTIKKCVISYNEVSNQDKIKRVPSLFEPALISHENRTNSVDKWQNFLKSQIDQGVVNKFEVP